MPDLINSLGYGITNPDGSVTDSKTGSNFQNGDDWRAASGLVNDSEMDSIQRLAKDLDIKLDSTTKDFLTEYYFNERSNENAWKRQMDASNTQYQRAVEDLRKAGLNPFLAISSLSGASSPSSSGQGVQGGLFTSRANNKTTAAVSALGVLAIIASAVIKFIL